MWTPSAIQICENSYFDKKYWSSMTFELITSTLKLGKCLAISKNCSFENPEASHDEQMLNQRDGYNLCFMKFVLFWMINRFQSLDNW